MNIKLDLRFVCYSLACFGVLGVGVYFLHEWQVQRQRGIFLTKAQEAETGGEPIKAISLYGQYLVLAPRDAEIQGRYGSLLFDARAFARSIQPFEAALRLDPQKSDVRRKAVKADMAIDRVPDARDHLENYLLKESPNDAELLDLEGQCLARAGDYLAAGRSLEAAIQRDPTRVSAYTQLIEILSIHGKDLDKDRQEWMANLPDEQKKALEKDNKWAEKTADYWADRLVNANPKDPEASQAYLFRGYWRLNKAIQARGRDQSAARDEPIVDSFDGAVQDAEAVLKLHPDDPAALRLAAISCQAAKKLDKARDYAARGVKAAPKDWRMYEILAQLDMSSQKPDKALEWLAKGVVDADGPPELWWELGRLQIATGKFLDAKETAEGLRNKTFTQVQAQASAGPVGPALYADLLEAQIEQVQGHWQDAAKRFGPLGPELKSAPELAKQAFYSLGKSYEQLADAKSALKAYRQAVDVDPIWISAREAVVASLQSLGRLDEAMDEQSSVVKLLEEQIKSKEEHNSSVKLKDDRDSVVELKNARLAAWAGLVRLSIAKTSRLPADQRDWGAVNGLINRFANSSGTSASTSTGTSARISAAVPLFRADVLMAQDNAAEAEKLLETAKNQNPKEIAFWIGVAGLAIRDNRWERADQVLEAAEKECGDGVALRLVRAQYLVGKGEKDAAEQLHKLAENTKDFSRPEQDRLLRGLVAASLALNDFSQAERLGGILMADSPRDLRVRQEMFELAVQARDFKLMDAALDEIHRVESDGPIWHYAAALRLILPSEKDRNPPAGEAQKPPQSEKQPEKQLEKPVEKPLDEQRQAALREALDHLAEALRLRPDWSRALMLQGLVYEESQQDDAALAKYLEAVRQGESSPLVARRALRLLFGKGEYAAANNLLRQLEGQQVQFTTELFREQSMVLSGLQDYLGALKAAQRVAASSKNYRDYLWLGQLCSILGRRDEAEKAFQKASQLDEKAPEPWVALVQFFVGAGQKDLAEKALASAREKIPAAEAPLALAECLEILGKSDEAGQQYVLALKQKPDDPAIVRRVAIYHIRKGELPQAAEQLARIIGGQVKATPQQLAEARGALARVRADQGGYQNLLEAVRLVDENLAAAPASTDNLRLKARLLAAYPQTAKRLEAVAIFEKLVEDPRNAAAEDRFRLAQYYLASGDWPKTRRQMLALLAAQGSEPRYVAAYAEMLLEHKEPGEAQRWTDRLEQIAPDNPRTAQLRAEVQFRAGKIDEAIETLTKFVDKAPAGSPDRSARTVAAAAQLEGMASRSGTVPVFAGYPRSGSAKTGLSPSAGTGTVPVFVPAKTGLSPSRATGKAESLYRQYVKENPKQGLVLAGFLGRQKRFDEALQLAEEASPSAEPPQIALACEVLLRQPGLTPAQVNRLAAVVSAALEKYARPAPLLLVLAQARVQQEKLAEAEALYREILQKEPDNAAALNNLAELLALSGRQLDEARTLIEKAVALAGPNTSFLDTRASVYLALGDPEKALADLTEAAAQAPRAAVYFHIALAQRKTGNKEAAAEAMKQAQNLGIRPESLQPLERPAYAELVRALQ